MVVRFSNSGELRSESGTLDIAGSGANAGIIHLGSGHIVYDDRFVNSGQITVGSGSFNNFDNAGTLRVVNGHKYLGDPNGNGGGLTNTGTIIHEATDGNNEGEFRFDGTQDAPGVLDNQGLYDITADGSMYAYGFRSTRLHGRIDNSGTFRKSGGEGTFSIHGDDRLPFHNTGTVEVTSGTLDLQSGGSSTNGRFAFDNGGQTIVRNGFRFDGLNSGTGDGVLQLRGQVVADGTLDFRDGSRLEIAEGSISGTAVSIGDVRWSGGRMSGFTSAGTLRVVNGHKYLGDPNGNGGGLTNTGTIIHEATDGNNEGEFRFDGTQDAPGVLDNQGLYDITADGSMYAYGFRSTRLHGRIDNSGTFRKSGGEGTFSIHGDDRLPFHNTGTVEVTSGRLGIFSGYYQSDGTVRVGEGSTFDIGSNNAFTGGTITGTGTLTGNVSNTGATVSPGSSPGTLTIDGNYTQGADARLLIEIAGLADGEFDVLNITGTATLTGGTLEVVLLPGDYDIPMLTEFDFLQAGTLTGSFSNFILPTDEFGAPLFLATPDSATGDFTLTALQDIDAVPEPASLAVMVIGSWVVLMSRRRNSF